MTKELTKNEYWALFQKLPTHMKEFILSEDTAIDIFNVCDENKIELEKISDVAKIIGKILLGILSPDELENVLNEEINLKKPQARLMNQEIQKIIFSPIKEDLEKLYSIKLDIPEIRKSEPYDDKEVNEITKKKTPRKDSYRETVEEI